MLTKENWENLAISSEELSKWREIYKYFNSWEIKQWKFYFSHPEIANKWIYLGLDSSYPNHQFAYYLETNKTNKITREELKSLRRKGIDCQEWINTFYPPSGCIDNQIYNKNKNKEWNNLNKTQKEIVELDLGGKKLNFSLDLNNFINLTKLRCCGNKLTSLNLISCNNLENLDCRNNQLSSVFFPEDTSKLTALDLSDNKFSSDLSIFSNMINLEILDLWSNNFYGSLKPLKELFKLKNLTISDTNINDGVEFLPKNIEKISYSSKNNSCKVSEIKEELNNFSYQLTSIDVENKFKFIPFFQLSEFELIGSGGYGNVYKAKYARKDKWNKDFVSEVAVKIFNKQKIFEKEFCQELVNCQIFDPFNNSIDDISSIIQVLGISRDKAGNFAIVMNYHKEGSLREYWQKNQIDLEDKIEILKTISRGLKQINDKSIVHKDFHSGNVLVSSDCHIVVSDLGISGLIQEQKVGKIFGVLPFIAPEILKGNPYTHFSDVYSFGIMAYELLTHTKPRSEEDWNKENFINEIVSFGKRPNWKDSPYQVPKLLINLIEKCWNDNPFERPNSREVSEIFDNWIKEDERNDKRVIDIELYQQIKECEEYNKNIKLKSNLAKDYPLNSKWWKKIQNISQENSKLKEGNQNQLSFFESKLNSLKTDLNSEKQLIFDQFINLRQEHKRNEDNQEIKKQVGKLEKELKKDQDFAKIIQEIKNYCDKLVELELEKETEQQVLIEQPTK